jgi:predicted DNA binding CopG/RHH family protein
MGQAAARETKKQETKTGFFTFRVSREELRAVKIKMLSEGIDSIQELGERLVNRYLNKKTKGPKS